MINALMALKHHDQTMIDQFIEQRIVELASENGQFDAVVFKGGRRLPRRALFFDTPCVSQSQIARTLGCQITKKGGIRCGRYEATSVLGVFVRGASPLQVHQARSRIFDEEIALARALTDGVGLADEHHARRGRR